MQSCLQITHTHTPQRIQTALLIPAHTIFIEIFTFWYISYMCVYIHVYAHTNIYIYIYKHTYIHIYTYKLSDSSWYLLTPSLLEYAMPLRTSILRAYASKLEYARMYVCVYIYIYIYTCTHTHIYTYTHTHTHTQLTVCSSRDSCMYAWYICAYIRTRAHAHTHTQKSVYTHIVFSNICIHWIHLRHVRVYTRTFPYMHTYIRMHTYTRTRTCVISNSVRICTHVRRHMRLTSSCCVYSLHMHTCILSYALANGVRVLHLLGILPESTCVCICIYICIECVY
jgi:hypothetical protein